MSSKRWPINLAWREWLVAFRRPSSRRRNPHHPTTGCETSFGAVERLEDRTLLSGISPVAKDDQYTLTAGGTIVQSAGVAEVETLNTLSISGSSGEKPQSKVWNHNGQWYSVFATSGGTYVWRLDGTSWTQSLQLSTSKANADVKQVGDVVHVLLHGGGIELRSIEFDSATSNYRLWSQRSTLVSVPSTSSIESASIDVDSTGRMWMAYEQSGSIIVRYSDGDYSSWSSPITLATGIKGDDLATVVALPGQVGVFWSNQNSHRFGFRVHNDGDPPTVWSADENPAGQYPETNGSFSDDHMNLEVKADGTLYAAVKTSFNSSGEPCLILLVRRPNGVWDHPYAIDGDGTRPTIAARANSGDLIYAYRNTNGSGPINYRELYDDGTAITFIGPEKLLINGGSYNNVSSTKDPFGDDIVLVAAGGGDLGGTRIRFSSGVLSNDTDAERDSLTAALVDGPQHGSLTLNPDGSFTYTHNGDSATSDTFTYRVFDGTSFSNVATVSLSILHPNAPPVVVNDSYSIAHGATLNANDATGTSGGPENNGILANDSDPDGNALSALLVSGPTHGTLSLNNDGTFTYVHNGDNATSDTFTYRASDGSLQSSIATVTIAIGPAPSGPVNNAPTATNDSYSIAHGATLIANDATGTSAGPENNGLLANDSDPDGNPLSAILVAGPSHGTLSLNNDGTFTYIHNGDNATSDSFTYRASDGSLQSGTATVNITIAAPSSPSSTPTTISFRDGENGYSGTTDTYIRSGRTNDYSGETALQIDGSPDAAALIRWEIGSIPSNSIVQSASITLYVTNSSSQEFQIYEALKSWIDNQANWDQAANGISWGTAGAQGAVDRGTQLASFSPSSGEMTITLSGAGLAIIQKWISNPSTNHGILIQNYNNSNGADFNSSEVSTVSRRPRLTITYASATSPAADTNTPPVVANDSYSIAHGATLVANDATGTIGGAENNGVLVNDSDPQGTALTAILVSGPSHGTLSFNNDGTFTYVHNGDNATSDSFTYRASDGSLDSGIATVNITIAAPAPVNNAPTATNDSYSIAHGATLIANDATGTSAGPENNGLLANDSDPDGNPLSAILVAGPSHGTLSLNNDGTFTYIHNGDNATSDSFTYRASDGSLQSGTATVNITIAAPSSPSSTPTTISFRDGENGYDGTTDATIRSGRTTDTSAATNLEVDGSPDAAALIRWEIGSIPSNSIVQSASITLYVTNSSSQEFQIYEALKSWIDNQANWDQAANGISWGTAGAQGAADRGTQLASFTPSSGELTITLSGAGLAVIQKWISDPSTNHGILIQGYDSSNGADFNSSEVSTVSRRPQLTITYAAAAPLVADAVADVPSGLTTVTDTQLASIAREAQARLAQKGIDTDRLQAVSLRWADLAGNQLALAAGNTILLDRDAAGYGWFVDSTLGDDAEFSLQGTAHSGSEACDRMDLLSTIAHEYGHILGLEHESGGFMDESLAAGERTLLDFAAMDAFYRGLASSDDPVPLD